MILIYLKLYCFYLLPYIDIIYSTNQKWNNLSLKVCNSPRITKTRPDDYSFNCVCELADNRHCESELERELRIIGLSEGTP